eukprot:scaffold3577_cov60-Attheya_sp.AAC.3
MKVSHQPYVARNSSFLARVDFQSTTLSSSTSVAPNKSIMVFYRNSTRGSGFKKDDTKKAGSTVGSLKVYVVGLLNQYPYVEGLVLNPTNIRVYMDVDGQLELLDEDTHGLCSRATYVALEFFTMTPTNLLRTVKLNQLFPAVYSHPDDVDRSWTKVSPLYWSNVACGTRTSRYSY